MKWTKKGSEFEKYKGIFNKNSKVYIYGAGELGNKLQARLSTFDCIGGFIDNDVTKQGNVMNGAQIYSIIEAMNKIDKGKDIVVVALGRNDRVVVMQQMRTLGFHDGFDLFDVDAFSEYYISIFLFYAYNKLYFHSVGTTLTTVCNFRCKGCLAFIPYNRCQQPYDELMFEKSISSLFNYVDYVDIFQLSGGETFLYQDQVKLIEFIGTKYRNKINILHTTTNGSIEPSEELCMVIKKYSVTVIVDDYSDYVPKYKDKLESTIQKLEEYGISYIRNKVDTWIDLAPMDTDNSNLSEKELISYYGACSQPWIELFENKLYSCNYAQYAMRAKMIEETDNDYFLLEDVNKEELLEFRMKYTQQGYLEMCKRCAGYLALNQHHIKPAEQWD